LDFAIAVYPDCQPRSARELDGLLRLYENHTGEVKMPVCDHCRGSVESSFRFCPWCASPLRLKIVEYFPADQTIDTSTEGLRVSRYFGEHTHSRFSIWSAGRTEAVVSLDAEETDRLGHFLVPPRGHPRHLLRAALHRNVRVLRDTIMR